MTELPFLPGALLSAYFRDSGGRKQELSVPQQEAHFRHWCEENGFIVGRLFADAARPGGSVVGRDQLDGMVKYFESGAAKEAGVVFWDYSRWARNFDDGQYFLSSLRRLGYKVFSLENYVPAGSTGKVVEALYLWSAEQFRERLSSDVKRGLYYVITVHHCYPRAVVPVGYRKVPVEIGPGRDGLPRVGNRLEPDPVSAPLVRQAYEMRLGGASISEIHDATHLHKHRPNYQTLLKSALYIGVMEFGDLRVENFCEPLVDRVTWDAVQEINREWAERHEETIRNPRRASSPFLLSGLAVCAICGWRFVGLSRQKQKKFYRYYRCGKNASSMERCKCVHIRADELDNLVLEKVREYILSPDLLQGLYDEAAQLAGQGGAVRQAQLLQAQSELRDATSQIGRLVEAIAVAGHSQALIARLAELETLQSGLRSRVAKLQGQAAAAPPALLPADIEQLSIRLRDVLENGDFRKKQLMLRSFIVGVRAAKLDKTQPVYGQIEFYPPVARVDGQELKILSL